MRTEQEQLEEAASVIIAELMENDPHHHEAQQRRMVEALLDMHNSGMITINPPEMIEGVENVNDDGIQPIDSEKQLRALLAPR